MSGGDRKGKVCRVSQKDGTTSSGKRHRAVGLPLSWRSLVLVCSLSLADALALTLAGAAGLALSILVGNADWPGFQRLLDFHGRSRLADFLVAMIIWLGWFHFIQNRYLKPVPFWSEVLEVTRTAAFMALTNLAIIAISRNDYSRTIWLTGWLAVILMVPLFRMLARRALQWVGGLSRPTFIIGQGENAREASLALQSEWQMGFDVREILEPAAATGEKLVRRFGGGLQGPGRDSSLKDKVFVIALEDAEGNSASLIQELTLAGARSIYMIPALRGIPLYGADLSYFFSHEVLFLGVRNNLAQSFSKFLKVGFDFILTLLILIPALPVMLTAAVLILLEDGGPVFYRQKRLGRYGEEFSIIKLRSMRKDADSQLELWKSQASPEWIEYCANGFKLKNDPRLLSVGAALRRASIDELPQLFNVLLGEMSLVGPRPLLSREQEVYGKNFALYALVRPGMTGLWQVSGRNDQDFSQRPALDAWYIRNWSLSYDVLILLKTISVVLSGRGAH